MSGISVFVKTLQSKGRRILGSEGSIYNCSELRQALKIHGGICQEGQTKLLPYGHKSEPAVQGGKLWQLQDGLEKAIASRLHPERVSMSLAMMDD